MKQLLVVAGLIAAILTSCNNKPNYNAKIKNETDSISYLIGIAYGKQLKSGGELSDLNIDALAKGMNEAFNNDSVKITDEDLNMKLSTYLWPECCMIAAGSPRLPSSCMGNDATPPLP
jgi:hypothetical protein